MMSDLQRQIVEEMQVKQTIDPKEEVRRIIDFIKEYVLKHSFLKTMVLGISGGQDSTLLGRLCQLAAEELREETGQSDYQFIALRLPYGEQQDEDDAKDAIEWIQADRVMKIDIKPSVDAHVKSIEANDLSITDFNKGNIKARMRMIAHYAVAGELNGVVIGTDHPAEAVTGFFTKHGDGGTDINPLFPLNKRQGKELLKELGAPEYLVNKTPTADLEEDNPGESDEEALGVTYDEIDDYLLGKEIAEESAEKIEEHYLKSQHKRHLPVTIFDDFWK
ncbi:ammonia-dependent NAD(+) synthetase [Alkalibacterium iburiense]|uniref:NH(3)-dependent NAD(+) synthetase n=2 Tax=Alkalibacterium iburiense TaxID=290589 RepID=A0ABN0XBP1_9LACT